VRPFTLSLPVSRRRLLGVRAVVGLAELLALALLPSLLIPLLSPAIGETYGVVETLIHGACLFIVATLFFTFAFLLSTYFGDPWRPWLIALALAFAVALLEQASGLRAYGVFGAMSGESYFRSGDLPWGGLLGTSAVSAAFYYGAWLSFGRRDF
jgi:hypothetical protein